MHRWGVCLCLPVALLAANQAVGEDAPDTGDAKRAVRAAMVAFNGTVSTARCGECRGSGKVEVRKITEGCSKCRGTGRITVYDACGDCRGSGRTVVRKGQLSETRKCSRCSGTGQDRGRGRTIECSKCDGSGKVVKKTIREECKVCAGAGSSLRIKLNRRQGEALVERYGLRDVVLPSGVSSDEVYSALYCLECYGQLRERADEHRAEVNADRSLRASVDRAIASGQEMLSGEGNRAVFGALAGALAKSQSDICGASVCLTGNVQSVVSAENGQYATLRGAGDRWLVRVPDGARWVQGATVVVMGRVVGDADPATAGSGAGTIVVRAIP
jgi:hypothetical protein